MSPELERLIGRAVTDKSFRDKLFADPDGAAKDAGFTLSDDEMDRLRKAVERAKGERQQLDQTFGTLGGW